MLYQNYSFEQSQNHIFYVLKELQIAKLLYKANIRKGRGLSALEMFQCLVMLVFHGKNLFHSLESKHNDHAVSKRNIIFLFALSLSGTATKRASCCISCLRTMHCQRMKSFAYMGCAGTLKLSSRQASLC